MTFGMALFRVRKALGISRATVAQTCNVGTRSVARWEKNQNSPSLKDRYLLLLLFRAIDHRQLEELAHLAGVSLDDVGIKDTSVAPVIAAPPALSEADAQKRIDDVLREAAEELNVRARDLRVVTAKLLDALGPTALTYDRAAALVRARLPS